MLTYYIANTGIIILINLRLYTLSYYALGQFQLAQKYNKPINKICGIRLSNISWIKYSPDISHIVEIFNISLHKYTQKMQHKNVLFIQEFSNWQFKHVQLLSYTVNHEIAIFWYARSSPLCFPFLAVKHYKYQHLFRLYVILLNICYPE